MKEHIRSEVKRFTAPPRARSPSRSQCLFICTLYHLRGESYVKKSLGRKAVQHFGVSGSVPKLAPDRSLRVSVTSKSGVGTLLATKD